MRIKNYDYEIADLNRTIPTDGKSQDEKLNGGGVRWIEQTTKRNRQEWPDTNLGRQRTKSTGTKRAKPL